MESTCYFQLLHLGSATAPKEDVEGGIRKLALLLLLGIPSMAMKKVLFTQVIALMLFFSSVMVADNIWIEGEEYESISGKISKGSDVGLKDKDALGDFLVVTDKDNAEVEEWYAQYTVKIPSKGTWFVWGRFRHPTGRDTSWCFDETGKGPNDLAIAKAMDNINTGGEEWFWSSNSNSADLPTPNLKATFPAGEVTFRIYERESPFDFNANSRLDVILLTDDQSYIPNDEDAEAGLAKQRMARPVESKGKLSITWGFLKRIY
jgi:hypothetical protein